MRTPTVRPLGEIFARFLRLGLTSFGGPIAHLGYFRREFVERARWLDDAAFAETVAVCSALPGPTSSQVGIALGALRGGPFGGLLAWLAFTTPSAVVMTLAGAALRVAHGDPVAERSPLLAGALLGLQGAASAVVLLAVTGMAARLTGTMATRCIAALAFGLALAVNYYAPQLQWVPLLAGGILGAVVLRDGVAALPGSAPRISFPRSYAILAAVLLGLLLVGLPFVATSGYPALFATFFRAGALVFGGGHVVLPFLQTFVGPEHVSSRDFYAGYGAAQAVPGPLFTFAAFLGADDRSVTSSWLGALVATLGIFAPSFLILAAVFPLWGWLRERPRAAATLAGLNAAVVGLLAAVFVNPIALGAIRAPLALGTGIVACVAFARFAAPAWLVVVASALGGATLEYFVRR